MTARHVQTNAFCVDETPELLELTLVTLGIEIDALLGLLISFPESADLIAALTEASQMGVSLRGVELPVLSVIQVALADIDGVPLC